MNIEQSMRAMAFAAGLVNTAAARQRSPAGAPGRHPPELCGHWCRARSVSGLAHGGACSGARLTLTADGRYVFATERSVSAYTADAMTLASSEGSDSGTWSVDGAVLTACSDGGGLWQFMLTKLNSARGEPLLYLNGECFASEQVRAPW